MAILGVQLAIDETPASLSMSNNQVNTGNP